MRTSSLILRLSMLFGCLPVHAASIQYNEDFSDFANPERGFYYQLESASNAPDPLSNYAPSQFADARSTVVRRLYNLLDFRATPISTSFLQQIEADLGYARQNGLKLNIRFAYTFNEPPPNNDAPLALIQQHIGQLQPLLAANADVISHLDAGFIGRWGEWHTSSNGNATTAGMTTVLTDLLAALPSQRAVVVRTPGYKRAIFNRQAALTPAEGFNGSALARTGHLNDCFLASDDDFGTYVPNDPASIAEQKAYIAAETRYVPMSGETCASNPPRSDCASALAEMAQLHWSILNYTYHPTVLQGWQSQGCFDEIRRRLGYRVVLRSATLPDQISPGGRLQGQINLQNVGFAAPFNPRAVELLLRNNSSPNASIRLPISTDPRRWLPDENSGNHNIVLDLPLPGDLPLGNYDLLLALPDPEPTLRANPAFAIRMANLGTWEAASGANRLLSSVVVVADGVYADGFE
ncbi:MAG: DUF4832 domain-containing protein [Lysobacterales bacterium]